jgi:hypothetical protein
VASGLMAMVWYVGHRRGDTSELRGGRGLIDRTL